MKEMKKMSNSMVFTNNFSKSPYLTLFQTILVDPFNSFFDLLIKTNKMVDKVSLKKSLNKQNKDNNQIVIDSKISINKIARKFSLALCMFDIDNQRQRETSASKQLEIFLIQNGSPDRLLKYSFKRPLNKQQVLRYCEKFWDTKYKHIRFFTIDGVEYEDDDISFIKNKERVYISRGEDFDFQSNFGEYKIIKPLGEGGFGKVMLAENIITKELAAVKIIKVQKISGATDIDMIFREIQNLKALNHPNIVKIINCYMLKNMQVYVVMEYLEGGQLLNFMREKRVIPEQQAKHYFRQITSAVSYCHRENIIHRDLKVENILFKSREEMFIKIADFGISGVADQFNPDFDAGTLKYMAPQVLSAKQKSNTPAVDVWACGVILYYMVFGCLPFNGTHTSQIIQLICQGKYTFPKEPFVTEQCKQLIRNILQINPKKRLKMDEIREHSWLQTRQSKLRKQLSLRLDSDYVLENDSIIEDQNQSQKLKKLKQIVNNGNRHSEKQYEQRKVKDHRKSLHFPRNQRKNTLGPVINIPKRLQKQKDKILQELQAFGQKSHFINNQRHAERRPMLFKGGSIEIGAKLGGSGGFQPPNSLNNSNYCSQQLPSLKDPLPLKGLVQSRCNPRVLNSSSNKREDKSRQAKDSRMKKKSSLISGWK